MKFEFSRQIFEKYLILNFMKFRLVGAKFHAHRRADRQTHDAANIRL